MTLKPPTAQKSNGADRLPQEALTRKRHQFREARTTLDYIVSQIEKGYDFSDEFGPRLIDEMRKISQFLEREYELLTELEPPADNTPPEK